MYRTLAALIFLLIANTAQALCNGPSFLDRLSNTELAELQETAAQIPYGQGLLWRATKGTDEIVVIGTIHLYDDRLTPIFNAIKDEIAEADVLLVEVNAEEEAAMQQALANDPGMIFITEGQTLPERLDPQLWDTLAEASRARQVPPFLAAKMQPWYLSLTLAIPPCALPDLVNGVQGLDHMVMDEAAKNDVPTIALEPFSAMLDLMREGTFDEQMEMLQLSLLAPEIHSEMFVAMLDAYFNEDIALVWEASRVATSFVERLDPERGAELFAQTEQSLLVKRNRNWMPVIDRNLQPKTVIAAGAAHLMGEEGLLRLLEKDGWIIERF